MINLKLVFRSLKGRCHDNKNFTVFNALVLLDAFSLQCFDAVGWVAGRASGL